MGSSTVIRVGVGLVGVSALALALFAKRPGWQAVGTIGLKTVSRLV